mmetsp:Transcript_19948/g.18954  ORF Transcript_19948/g.18954 Transcript_19948/m.18954 type:complete len:96 (+) Transcript_19948:440-727(+)
MPVDAVYPGLHVVKGHLVCQVERYYHPVRLPVKLICDRLEPLLPGSVPYFDIELLVSFPVLALDVVYSNCFYVGAGELLVFVLLKDGSLPHCPIT